MDEKQFLLRLLHATDKQSGLARGIEFAHTCADTYAWIAKAEKSGHVQITHGRALITDAGRARLAELTGGPLYPVAKFSS